MNPGDALNGAGACCDGGRVVMLTRLTGRLLAMAALPLAVALAVSCASPGVEDRARAPGAEPQDAFATGNHRLCPRAEYLVGTACAATLADAQRNAAAMIAEQVCVTVRSEVTIELRQQAPASARPGAGSAEGNTLSRVHVQASLDGAGLIRVVQTGQRGGQSCALSCLSKREAARQQQGRIATSRARTQQLLTQADGSLSRGQVVAALRYLPELRRLRARLSHAGALLRGFDPTARPQSPALVELDERLRTIEAARRKVRLALEIEVRGAEFVPRPVAARELGGALREALLPMGVLFGEPASHRLRIVAHIESVGGVAPTCKTTATVSLHRAASGELRSVTTPASGSRASRPTADHAARRSLQMTGAQVGLKVGLWFGEAAAHGGRHD